MMEGETTRYTSHRDEIEKAYQYFDGKSLMIEKFVDFKMEVSVIAGQKHKGRDCRISSSGKHS